MCSHTTYSVAKALEHLLPCCWWVVGVVLAVAMVAEVLKVEVVVGCLEVEEEGASYPWVGASYLHTQRIEKPL